MNRKVKIEDVYELSNYIFNDLKNGDIKVSVIAKFDEVSALIRHLLSFDEFSVYNIECLSEEINGNFDKYIVTISNDYSISCYNLDNIYTCSNIDSCKTYIFNGCDNEVNDDLRYSKIIIVFYNDSEICKKNIWIDNYNYDDDFYNEMENFIHLFNW